MNNVTGTFQIGYLNQPVEYEYTIVSWFATEIDLSDTEEEEKEAGMANCQTRHPLRCDGTPPLARFMLPLPFCAARPFRTSPGVSYVKHRDGLFSTQSQQWLCRLEPPEAMSNKAKRHKAIRQIATLNSIICCNSLLQNLLNGRGPEHDDKCSPRYPSIPKCIALTSVISAKCAFVPLEKGGREGGQK